MEYHLGQTTMNALERQIYVEQFNFPFCEEINKYDLLVKIGQGTFGWVKYLRLVNSIFQAMQIAYKRKIIIAF